MRLYKHKAARKSVKISEDDEFVLVLNFCPTFQPGANAGLPQSLHLARTLAYYRAIVNSRATRSTRTLNFANKFCGALQGGESSFFFMA